ncbi:MAG TPA: DUF5908 family protein [Flavobacteriales bacterium]|nr:DUF5908 family protein [Flavobacteriales bacterium]
MPIEIKELIIQALVGTGGKKKKKVKDEAKKEKVQIDVIDIVSKIIKHEKER